MDSLNNSKTKYHLLLNKDETNMGKKSYFWKIIVNTIENYCKPYKIYILHLRKILYSAEILF